MTDKKTLAKVFTFSLLLAVLSMSWFVFNIIVDIDLVFREVSCQFALVLAFLSFFINVPETFPCVQKHHMRSNANIIIKIDNTNNTGMITLTSIRLPNVYCSIVKPPDFFIFPLRYQCKKHYRLLYDRAQIRGYVQ